MLNLLAHTGLITLHTRVRSRVPLHSNDRRDRKFQRQLKVLTRGESMTYFMEFPCHAVAEQCNRTLYATNHFKENA